MVVRMTGESVDDMSSPCTFNAANVQILEMDLSMVHDGAFVPSTFDAAFVMLHATHPATSWIALDAINLSPTGSSKNAATSTKANAPRSA
ncbi:hypothetical protein SPRG_14573 [Saprolegnia parasitica CBS 223.65]|uniref:Uncharacterized protein n=1 Tax=Saprolegnia parasitica (strain CBS 223.65) TaxID=695850 RepID=A0A067BP07_SAPPC|nr:hypothetical protein SPRG_14573 [Saprolegnia parasitica CBS 223.65]KDO19993.1 hypothetical protein SPRG_14573 [Saprolegnia parasitica CBS 223.65]|eukprot:XP_012209296.1 hypothetical protein SPRG_14573 [Saprolegnia parasitica CBS 223.65]